MSVVEPTINVQARPSMSEVDKLTAGLVKPRGPVRPVTSAQSEMLSSLNPKWPENIFGQSNGILRSEGLPEFSPEYNSAMSALNKATSGPVRPPADFVHPADTSGGAFGFENLPSISEGELSRLQALFKRVTGR
jgi:hypothetical protein